MVAGVPVLISRKKKRRTRRSTHTVLRKQEKQANPPFCDLFGKHSSDSKGADGRFLQLR